MTLSGYHVQSTDGSVTDYARIDFARLCRHALDSNSIYRGKAQYELADLPLERACALLTALWHEEEPRRRRWASRHTFFENIAARFLLTVPIAVAVVAILWYCQVRLAWTALLVPWTLWHHSSMLADVSGGLAPEESQRGSLQLLVRFQSPQMVRFWVDALDFRVPEKQRNSKDIPSRAQIYTVLADLLPRLVDTDAPTLDSYQQKVLLNTVAAFAPRLRRRTARLSDHEARFAVAAIHYLSTNHDPSLSRATLRVIQQLAALKAGGYESENRRLVREVASDCLLWCR